MNTYRIFRLPLNEEERPHAIETIQAENVVDAVEKVMKQNLLVKLTDIVSVEIE